MPTEVRMASGAGSKRFNDFMEILWWRSLEMPRKFEADGRQHLEQLGGKALADPDHVGQAQ
jgi:hypothetical protein